MKIAMIGAGYVGLVTGACLADFGHEIVCIDNNPERVAALSRGEIPIFEPGLDELVETNEEAGRLRFTGTMADGVSGANAVFIAVGTPSRRGDGHADLSYVYAAAREIAPLLTGYVVVVTKSTVPVGTGDEVERIIREANPGAEFAVVSNPNSCAKARRSRTSPIPTASSSELTITSSRRDVRGLPTTLAQPGAADVHVAALVRADQVRGQRVPRDEDHLHQRDRRSAEVAGANVQDVARGIGADNRIGGKFLNAGPGYGGSCFPKDTQALMRTAQELGRPLRLVEATTAVNNARHAVMVEKIVAACGGTSRASASVSSASPSSPIPTTCAMPRRSPSSPTSRRVALTLSPMTPKAWRPPSRYCPA